MCKFFSVVSDGAGEIMYFNADHRKQIISGTLVDKNGNRISETDSHSSIMAYNEILGKDEDMYNKYEYNPLTKEFVKDHVSNKDDSAAVKGKCMSLDFKTVVPELQVKEIINPLNIQHSDTVSDSEIALLEMWDSVRDSVWASVRASVGDSVWASVGASVWASVWASVGASVGDSVWASVGASVRASVRASVGDSVWASVWDSVWDSVWASVWDSVGAYISDFFTLANWKYIDHKPGKNPFQPCIDLWMLGLVPGFDGKTWRLHKMCDNAKIIYEWTK